MSTFNPQTIRVLAPASILFGAACLATPVQSADLEAGRKTFETTCAVCHGPAGKADPSSPTVQSLDPKPADLSDPLFNSREPASDWQVVVTHGGPALGLSPIMPAQGAALSGEEIRNVVAYAKTLAPGSEQYPPGELNFFLPARTKKAFPEDEVVWKGRVTERDDGDFEFLPRLVGSAEFWQGGKRGSHAKRGGLSEQGATVHKVPG